MGHILSSKALDLIFFFFFLMGALKSVKVIIRETRCFTMTQANLALVIVLVDMWGGQCPGLPSILVFPGTWGFQCPGQNRFSEL